MTEDRVEEDKDQQADANAETPTGERLAAHERLATGALAGWARMCATASVARRLRLDRNRRRARPPGDDGRGLAPGRVRDSGIGCAEGDRPDRVGVRLRAGGRAERRVRGARGRAARHARATGGDRGGDGAHRVGGVRAHRGHGRRGGGGRSLQRGHGLRRRSHRVRRGPVRSRHLRRGSRRGRRRPGRGPRGGGAGRRDGRVQRRRRVPAARAGRVRGARPAGGDHRAAGRVPHVRGGDHPDRAGAGGARDGIPAPVHPGRPDRHQHGHADPGLDDRPRRRHRLLAVHRHSLQTAAARGAFTTGRSRPGRRVGGAGGDLRRAHGRDLDQRPGLLRSGLRDQARHRQRTGRADHRADRQLAAARAVGAGGPQDRSTEGAVPASRSTTPTRPASVPSPLVGAAS